MDARRARERRSAEERRAQILAAAVHCFADKGFHAATMDDLAGAAGLSKGSLYWHFESKDDVFVALCEEMARGAFEAWDALEARGSVFERYVALVSLSFSDAGPMMELRPVWAHFFAHPGCRQRVADLYRDLRTRLADALAEEAGTPPAAQLGPASMLVAAAEGVGLQAMVDPDFDPETHWNAGVECLRRGFA